MVNRTPSNCSNHRFICVFKYVFCLVHAHRMLRLAIFESRLLRVRDWVRAIERDNEYGICNVIIFFCCCFFYLMCGVVWFPLTTWASRQQLNHYQAAPIFHATISTYFRSPSMIIANRKTLGVVVVVVVILLLFLFIGHSQSWVRHRMHREHRSLSVRLTFWNANKIFVRVYASVCTLWCCIILLFSPILSHLHCGRLFGVIFVVVFQFELNR